VTERDLNYIEDSAELFYERKGERCQIHLKRLRIRYPISAVRQPRERADADAAHAEPDHLRALTAVSDTSAQRAESAIRTLALWNTSRAA
jgi:hypothetical protein